MSFKSITLFFLLITNTIFSQRKIRDSIFFSEVLKASSQFHSNQDFKKSAVFFSIKNWDSTLIYSQKLLNKPNMNKEIKNFCYLFRGISFDKNKVTNEAINQFSSITPDFIFINRVKLYLGALNIKLNKFTKAIPYLKELESLSNTNNLYSYKNEVFKDLGICYLFLKEYEKSELYLKKSINNVSDTTSLIKNYTNFANLYYNQYKDNIAIAYFKKAYKLSKKFKINNDNLSPSELNDQKINLFEQKRRTARNMSVVEENRKDYKRALVYRKEMEMWKDSVNDQNRIYEVAQKEKEYAVKEKQQEVDLLQVENKLKETQRNIFLYSAIGLLLFLGIGAYFFREKVKTNKIIAKQKETLDELNATKDKLFSIVSHDLRSSVNALKSSNTTLLDNLASKNINALEGLLQKNSAIVNGAYGLLDNLLNWALLQTDKGYFQINSLRLFIIVEHVAYNYKPLLFEKDLSFENSVSKKDLVYADQESLKIVLRNLLDNAIKFSNPNGFIKVYSRNTSEEYCDLIVEDNGMGMTEETRLKLLEDTVLLHKKEHEEVIGTGLGLQLCKSMVRKNHGKFSIESELGKGTKMIVSLPKTPLNG